MANGIFKMSNVYVNIYTVDDKYVPFHRFQQLPIETVLRDKGAIENEG